MKIAFISRENPLNRKAWSGTIYSIQKCLRNINSYKVYNFGPLKDLYRIKEVLKRNYYNFFLNTKFDSNRTINLSRYYSKQIDQKLDKKKYDYIFTTDPTLVAFIKSKIPVIIWTDATFDSYYKLYFKNKKIHKDTLRQGKIIERKAFENSKFIFFSSKWALNSGARTYPKIKRKFKVIKYGSNFSSDPLRKKIIKNVKKRSDNLKNINLISVGVDWKRKGMNDAIKLNKYLNLKGIKSKLTIVGSFPTNNNLSLNNTKIIRFLDKNIPNDEKKLSEMYLKSHFNVLFTRAEAYGISLVEANAHGIPNIAYDIGGIQSIIKNGINGKVFNKYEKINEIGNHIINIIKNKNSYISLCNRSYMKYIKDLKWDASGKKIKKLLKNTC